VAYRRSLTIEHGVVNLDVSCRQSIATAANKNKLCNAASEMPYDVCLNAHHWTTSFVRLTAVSGALDCRAQGEFAIGGLSFHDEGPHARKSKESSCVRTTNDKCLVGRGFCSVV
jgi:hypothetical protein